MTLSLDKRLNMAASLVRAHRFTVDVGTDHAYLPAFLVLSGITDTALACDVAVGPLKNAAMTIEKYNLGNKITLCLSDGLKDISPFDDGDIVICGMGGNLISDILEAAPWICRNGIHLVLQPMSHCEDVRRWLCDNGFEIESESAVCDGKHIYICLSAFYSGQKVHCETGYYYFGKLKESDSEYASEYIQTVLCRIAKRADALKKNNQTSSEAEYLRKVIEYGESL